MQEAEGRVQDGVEGLAVWLLRLSTILSGLVLAVAFGSIGLWGGMGLAVVAGGLWLVGQRRGGRWVADLALACLAGAAAVGLLLGVERGWALLGLVGALVAWDLDHFVWRMRLFGPVEDARGLTWGHLGRLLAVVGVGGLLGAVALGVRVRFGFGSALLLAALAVLGLSQVVGFLRREGE